MKSVSLSLVALLVVAGCAKEPSDGSETGDQAFSGTSSSGSTAQQPVNDLDQLKGKKLTFSGFEVDPGAQKKVIRSSEVTTSSGKAAFECSVWVKAPSHQKAWSAKTEYTVRVALRPAAGIISLRLNEGDKDADLLVQCQFSDPADRYTTAKDENGTERTIEESIGAAQVQAALGDQLR